MSAVGCGVRWARAAAASRRAQLVVVASVVALLVAFSGLTVLLTGSIGRTMVRQRVADLGTLGRIVNVETVSRNGTVPGSRLAPLLGSPWDGVSGPPVVSYDTDLDLAKHGDQQTKLLSREGACQHVTFSEGRCPTGRFEVAISPRSGAALDLSVGDSVELRDPLRVPATTRRTVQVVGVYNQPDDDPFWRGLDIESVPLVHVLRGKVRRHLWLTAPSSFAGDPPPNTQNGQPPKGDSPRSQGWSLVTTGVARALSTDRFGYGQLDDARDAAARTRTMASRSGHDIRLTEQATTVHRDVHADVDQIRVIAPLLLAQLVFLQAVLVWIVLRAVLTGRRQEVAVLRLRSPGRRGARRLLLAELTPPVLVGLPAGLGAAYGLDWLFRTLWLGGTTAQWSWLGGAAAALSTLGCLGILFLLIRRTAHAPVTDLLRVVPPRQHRWALSPLRAVVLTLAVGLLITVATGDLTGAPVLVTPLIIALATGLVLGGLLVPVGNRLAARLVRRGSLSWLLALTGLARRPSTRNLVLAMTASGALLAFSMSTLALGETNRNGSAEATVGAAIRLEAVDTEGIATPQQAVDAIDRADPDHRHLSPAIRVRSGSSDGPVTLAGRPADMSRIASSLELPDPWQKLGSTSLPGRLPAVVSDWSPPGTGSRFSAPRLTTADANYQAVGTSEVIAGADEKTFIAPLGPLLSHADRLDNYTAEVWSDGDRDGLRRAEAELRKLGFDAFTTYSVDKERERLDVSASAYGLQLGLFVAAGSVLVAALVLIAVLSSQARARTHDHRNLARTGVPDARLRRARDLEVLLSVLPLGLGGAVGWLGAWLAAPHVPWFTEPPPYPILSTLPPVLPALLSVAAGLVVVTLTAAVLGRPARPRQDKVAISSRSVT